MSSPFIELNSYNSREEEYTRHYVNINNIADYYQSEEDDECITVRMTSGNEFDTICGMDHITEQIQKYYRYLEHTIKVRMEQP